MKGTINSNANDRAQALACGHGQLSACFTAFPARRHALALPTAQASSLALSLLLPIGCRA